MLYVSPKKLLLCALIPACVVVILTSRNFGVRAEKDGVPAGRLLPTGKRITPLATPGARFETLNPELPGFPEFIAGQAISTRGEPGRPNAADFDKRLQSQQRRG